MRLISLVCLFVFRLIMYLSFFWTVTECIIFMFNSKNFNWWSIHCLWISGILFFISIIFAGILSAKEFINTNEKEETIIK